MAEQKFYETIAAIKKEREAKAAEEKKIEDKFDPKQSATSTTSLMMKTVTKKEEIVVKNCPW